MLPTLLVQGSAESSEARSAEELFWVLPAMNCPSGQQEARCLGRLRSLPLQGYSSSEGANPLCCFVKPPDGQMPA